MDDNNNKKAIAIIVQQLLSNWFFPLCFFFDNRVHRRVRSLSSAETKPQLCAISLTSRLEDRQGPIR
jgi:hypothetical protein